MKATLTSDDLGFHGSIYDIFLDLEPAHRSVNRVHRLHH